MTDTVLDRIRRHLASLGVPVREVRHAPARTSEAAARLRGEPLAIGAKSMVLRVDRRFGLFVLSAARRLDSRAVRTRFGASRLRFATSDELRELTGLEPGAVPPFGRPVLPLDLWLDRSVEANDRVAFTAGDPGVSMVLDRADYERAIHPAGRFAFSRRARGDDAGVDRSSRSRSDGRGR